MTEPLVQLTRRAPFIHRSIDNTALQSFMECPRKYFFSMVLHRRKGGATRPPLAYGTTWHKIMETHYATGGDEAAVQRAAIMSWEPHDSPDDHRTLERVLDAYRAYKQRYGEHDEDVRVWGRTVGFPENPIVEQVAELAWPGSIHPYTGKIDRIYEQNGAVFIEDYKTTSALGATYFRQWDPSNQMMGYAWLGQLLTGRPIAGVRINVHGVLKTTNKFERQTILISPERLNEWSVNLQRWLEDINRRGEQLEDTFDNPEFGGGELTAGDYAFPANFNACAGKYGMCQYVDVCTMPRSVRARILENDFEHKPWDPTVGDDEGGGGEA